MYRFITLSCEECAHYLTANNNVKQDAMLSQGVPRNTAANFGMHRSFQWHCAVFTAIATLSNYIIA